LCHSERREAVQAGEFGRFRASRPRVNGGQGGVTGQQPDVRRASEHEELPYRQRSARDLDLIYRWKAVRQEQ